MVAETHRLEALWKLERQQKEQERKNNEHLETLVSLKERDISEQNRNQELMQGKHRLEVIAFERQLQLLRLELKNTNIRISQEAKD